MPNDTFTLLIWEDFNLEAQLFMIPNGALSHAERNVLRTAHGLLEGDLTLSCPQTPDEKDAIGRVFCAVRSPDNGMRGVYPELADMYGKWLPYALPAGDDDAPIENAAITHVYRCGVSL